MILVITRASLLCGKVRCPRIVLDSWFLWWEMAFKDRKMGVPGVLCFLPPESREKKIGHHQPTRRWVARPSSSVPYSAPHLFLCGVSQRCWDAVASKRLGTSPRSRYCVCLVCLGTQWRPPRLQIVAWRGGKKHKHLAHWQPKSRSRPATY